MKRKPPKNLRPYATPSGRKARMVTLTDQDELQRLLSYGPGDLGAPTLYRVGSDWAANASELRRWRDGNTSTSGAEHE